MPSYSRCVREEKTSLGSPANRFSPRYRYLPGKKNRGNPYTDVVSIHTLGYFCFSWKCSPQTVCSSSGCSYCKQTCGKYMRTRVVNGGHLVPPGESMHACTHARMHACTHMHMRACMASTRMHTQVCVSVKRDLFVWEKRPINIGIPRTRKQGETCDGKRDLFTGKEAC